MDKDSEIKNSSSEPEASWRDLDDETIEILVDDKIATGG